eukprot:5832900-Prymnesium_polylepis.1
MGTSAPERLAALFDSEACQSAIDAAEPPKQSARQLAKRPSSLASDLGSTSALNIWVSQHRSGLSTRTVTYVHNQK